MTSNLSLITAATRAGVGPESDPGTPSAAAFSEAMSALASGVVLVTCDVDGRQWGTTVTAFASVSSDPPTVLVSLSSQSRAAQAIAATGGFGVSLLSADQVGLARFGAKPGAPKFLEPPGESLTNALAQLECTVSHAVVIADHTVFFGRVHAAHPARDGDPLVYQRRGYRRVAHLERSPTCAVS